MERPFPLKALTWATVLALLVAACTSATEPEEPTEIVLMTHDSFAVSDDVLASFEAETGITVSILRSGDLGIALNQAILTKDSPVADVFFGVDNTFLTRALEEDIFHPYVSPELASVPDDLELDDRVTPIDFGDVCLNYDKAAFTDLEPPATLADLTDPAYEGLLVVEHPATSSPGLAFLLATIATFGEEGWQQFWAGLVANDVLVVAGWEEAYFGEFSGADLGGVRPLVVSYASSPPAAVIFDGLDEAPTAVITDGCFRQIEFAGILKPSRAAERFVDFMLSPEFQADVPLNMFVFPVREDVPLPPEFVEHTVVPTDPATLDPATIAANRDSWIRMWVEIVLP